MAYTKVNYRDVGSPNGVMHFLRDPLGCDSLGVTVVECPPGWSGKAHDHADGDHEEVYLLLDGEATLEIDGEPVSLTAGDAVRVAPAARRQIQNGDVDSRIVIAGAP